MSKPMVWTDGFEKVDTGRRARDAKIAIRRAVAEAIAGPLFLFDAFAGTGELYRSAWRDVVMTYTACDQRYFNDGLRRFAADNRRVLRAIDLYAFNAFDLDAWGSPWQQALIIAKRRPLRPGERVGLVLTEGNGLNYKGGIVPHAVRELTGLRHQIMPGAALSQMRPEVQMRILHELARIMQAKVVRFWKAEGKSGASVVYMGVVLTRPSAPQHGPTAGSENSPP